jgi:Maltokinase N-terminal cap domain
VAVLYDATLTPSKIELLRAWVPAQPWLGDADASALEAVGAYRFDDPDGEVGVETHLLRTVDGRILQVPLTYRGSPSIGAELSLIGTMQHSVLGERWVYDGCADPVYVRALATAVLCGGTQAELEVVTDAGNERRQATTLVSGSGASDSAIPGVGAVTYSNEETTTVIGADHLELIVFRTVDRQPDDATPGGMDSLVGTWPGHDTPALLALAQAI